MVTRVKVVDSNVTVHSDPDERSTIIAQLDQGSEITIHTTVNRRGTAWTAISLQDGRNGHARGNFAVYRIRRVTLEQDSAVIYERPSSASKVIGSYARGDAFTVAGLVTQAEAQWVEVRSGTLKSGYIDGTCKTRNLPTSFACLIVDRPLSGYEQFAVGITTAGVGRGVFREAVATVEDDDLVISANTDAIAGGNAVIVARVPLLEISQVKISPLIAKDQEKALLARSLISGGGIGLAIAIGVYFKTGQFSVVQLLGALLFGFLIGFVFSYLTSSSKLQTDLQEVLVATSAGKAILLALRPSEKTSALEVLGKRNLSISDNATTPPNLNHLCKTNNVQGLRDAVAAGCDLNATDESKLPPIVYAAANGNLEAISFLIKAGAVVDCHHKWGTTALTNAAMVGREDVVDLLLTSGANPKIKDRWGRSAADWAHKHKHIELAERLRRVSA